MSIESIHQRLDAGTPKPWRVSPRPGTQLVAHWIDDGRQYELFRSDRADPNEAANVDLVAHASTDLALLLAVAEVVKAQDHQECGGNDLGCRVCYSHRVDASWTHCHCGALWPCPSKLALDALDAAE